MSEHSGRPGLESDSIPPGPRSVVAILSTVPAARSLVEELEQHGIPPGSIALGGAVPPEDDSAQDDMPESTAIVDVTRATVVGGALGALAGAGAGALLTMLLTGFGPFWAVILGAVFGGGIGLAAGGMAVVKYNSPAWRESYEAVEWHETVSVGVHDQDEEIVASAQDLMERRGALEVRRLDDNEP